MNSFKKNIIILSTGTMVAQSLPIIVSPILTRLFTPSDFGNLAIFMSTILILSSIVTLRYDLAIMLPKDERSALNLVSISIINTTLISTFIFLLSLIAMFRELSVVKDLGIYVLFIPLVTFLIGIYNTLNYYNTRHKKYTLLAQVKIIKSFTIAITQVILGSIFPFFNGLIIGEISGSVVSNGRLLNKSLSIKQLKDNFSRKRAIILAKNYKDFPLYSMPAHFTSLTNTHSINYFIKYIFNAELLGFYSLIMRVLAAPSSIIGQAIGQVFYQQAASDNNKYGNSKKIYIKTFLLLTALGLIFGVVLHFFIKDLIILVYGEEWLISGELGQVLVPLIIIKFIAVPLSTINSIYKKQHISLIWQIFNLVLTITVFIYGYIASWDFMATMEVYTWMIFFNYILLILITYKVSKG